MEANKKPSLESFFNNPEKEEQKVETAKPSLESFFVENEANKISPEYQKEIRAGRMTASSFDQTLAEAERIKGKEGVTTGGGETFANQAINTALFNIPKAIIGTEYREMSEKAFDDNLLMGTAGTIFGFFLNPAGMAVRGAMAGKAAVATTTATRFGTGVVATAMAETLAVEGGAAITDIVDAAIRTPGSLTEKLKESGVSVAKNTLMAGGFSAGIKAVLAPKVTLGSANKVVNWAVNKVKGALPNDTAKILENADLIMEKGGKEGLAREAAKQFDALNGKLNAAKQKVLADGTAGAEDMINTLQASLDKHSAALVEGVADPKATVQGILGLAEDFKLAQDGMSSMYGIHLDKISKMTKGKKAPFSEGKKAIMEMLEMEGAVDLKGKFTKGHLSSKYPAAEKVIRRLQSTDEISHTELGTLVKSLGDSFIDGTGGNVDTAARKAFTILRGQLTDPKIWGDEVAIFTNDLLEQYKPAQELFNGLRKSTSQAKKGIEKLKDIDGEDFLSNVEDLYSVFHKAEKGAKAFADQKMFSELMPPKIVNKIKTGLNDTKKLIDYNKAKDIGKSRKILESAFRKQDASKIPDEALRDSITKYKEGRKFLEEMGARYDALPEIGNAFRNPNDPAAIRKAVRFTQKYANSLSPKVKENVAALSKYSRLAKIKPTGTLFAKELKTMKEVLSPSEIEGLQIFKEFVPEAEEVAELLGLSRLLANKDASFLKLIDVDVFDLGLVKYSGAKVLPLLILKNIAKAPIQFRLLVSKYANKTVSETKMTAIIKGAQAAAIIGEEMSNE